MKHIVKNVLMLAAMLLASATASAYYFESDGIYYYVLSEEEKTAEVTYNYKDIEHNSYSGNVIIPEQVKFEEKNYTITAIGSNAFFGCSGLTSIELPVGVTSIGDGAFFGCSGLTSIELPSGVTSIGDRAFLGCSGLTSIELPAGVTSISDNAFYDSSGLTSIELPAGLVSIGDRAFGYCQSLTSIYIPSGVTSIGDDAFYGCYYSLKEIYCCPLNPPSIKEMTFEGCFATIYVSIKSYSAYKEASIWSNIENKIFAICFDPSFEENGIYYNVLSEDAKTVEVTRTMNVYTGSVTIPNEVTHDEVTYSVVAVGKSAFINCPDLRIVIIPNSVASIGSNAFYSCETLAVASLPDGITEIGESAFYRCENLRQVTIPNGVTAIGDKCFYDCTALASVKIGSGVTAISTSAFSGCSKLEEILIPDNVETIGGQCFYDCTTLASVTIGSGVTSIGASVFTGCSKLATINVSKDNRSYVSEDGVLYNMDMTELLRYPAGKMEQSFDIPSTVTTVAAEAFSDSYIFYSVTIPASVTTIGDNAFSGCNGLKEITSVSPTPPAISANTFDSSHYSNAQLIIPVGATVDYLMADNWYNFINIKEMELSGVDEVAEACVSVAAVDGEIVVSGADDSVVDVYSIGGQLLYSGMDTTVGGLAHGIYIVRVAGQTFKVAV